MSDPYKDQDYGRPKDEARTQGCPDCGFKVRTPAEQAAARGCPSCQPEPADPTCKNTDHKFSHCDCPETGQPGFNEGQRYGRQDERRRIVALIEGERDRHTLPPPGDQTAILTLNRILTAIEGQR